MRTLRLSSSVAVLALIASAAPARADIAGTPDPLAYATNGQIAAFARAPGKTFIGGSFTTIGPRSGSFVAVSRSTGKPAFTMPEVAGGQALAVVDDGSGGYFVGGSFTHVDRKPMPRLAHIRADGTLDPGFTPAPAGTVTTLALAGDGARLFVGGDFQGIGGQPRKRLAAVDISTGSATAWAPEPDNTVDAIVRDGSNLYVAGSFQNIGGQVRNGLARVSTQSGAASATWDPGDGSDIRTLALRDVGGTTTLVVGGIFAAQTIGGATRTGLAELSTGVNATATALDVQPNGTVRTLAISAGGATIYFGGSFTSVKVGITTFQRTHLAAVSGSSLTSFAPAVSGGTFGAPVSSLAVDGTRLFVGGSFSMLGGQPRLNAGELDAATGAPTGWDPAPGDPVNALSVAAERVALAGNFVAVGAVQRQGLAALDARGRPTEFTTPITSAYINPIATLAVTPDGGTLYVGGNFTGIGGQPRISLAALRTSDGTATDFDARVPSPSSVNKLALSPDAKTLYVQGGFTAIGRQDPQPSRARLAALDAATGTATEWNPNQDGGTFGIFADGFALSPDGSTLYVGGSFTTFGADHQPRTRVAGVSTAGAGNATAFAPNPDSAVPAIAVAPDGNTVYLGGLFSNAGGQPRKYIGAFGPDGTATTWNPPALDNIVFQLAVDPTGARLYGTGQFTTVGAADRRSLAAWSTAGTGDVTGWAPNAGAQNGSLRFAGPTLYVGNALQVGGYATGSYAQFTEPPVNTAVPKLTGVVGEGSVVTCDDGTWRFEPDGFTRQWARDGVAIDGAVATTYAPVAADVGKSLSCAVTATNAGGSATATSAGSTVAAAPGSSPTPTKLTLTKLKLSRTKFRVSSKSTATSAATKRGTTISYTLSKPAKVTLVIARRKGGILVARKCVKNTAAARRKLGKRRRTTCDLTVGTLTRKAKGAGAQKVAFSGRIGRRKLAVASYVLSATATAGSEKTRKSTVKFKIVRR